MKAIFKSQIIFGVFYVFCAIYGLTIYLTWNLTDSIFIKYIIVIITPILSYIVLALWINCYYFYKDKLKIVYLFRFKNREKDIPYTEIKEIIYMHLGGYGNGPMIVIAYQGKPFTKIAKPSNSFTNRSFKKRKEILKFLESKGILIKINSVFRKDETILD